MSAYENLISTSTSIKNFIPLDKIGTGSFSSVYKVKRIDDDQIYALKKVKIMSLKQRQKQNALNQIRILASLNSDYIISYKEAFFDQKLNLLCIVMQYANDGDLNKAMQNQKKKRQFFPQSQIWKMIHDILRGLQILHSSSIMHRDIKSANIFISNGVYKLGDLNVAKINDTNCQLAFTQTGTPNYASPQVWRDQPYDNKSDLWSLGCVIYQMCTFKAPFKGRNLDELYKSVQKGYYQPISKIYSQELAHFIEICLKKNPFQRLSATQFLKPNGIVMKNIHCQSRIQAQIMNPQQNKNKLINKINVPLNLRDIKTQLPKSKYNLKTKNSSNQSKSINENQNQDQPLSPLVYCLDQKKEKKYQLIKSPSTPKKLSIKHTQNSRSIAKEVSINKQKIISIQPSQKHKGLLKEINLLKNAPKKYSIPQSYSQRNIIYQQKQQIKDYGVQGKRLMLEKRNSTKNINSSNHQNDLKSFLQQKQRILQQKRLRNINSQKNIMDKLQKRIGAIERQHNKISHSYLHINQLNLNHNQSNADLNSNRNNISDSKNVKLKKISSSPYICQHNAKIKLALNKVRNMGIDQKKLDGKRYLLIAK